MSSVNAENVGLEVLETLGKEEKVKLGAIALRNGYAPNTAKNPKNITETKSYKRVVTPFLTRLIKHRDKLLRRMEETIDDAEYNDLSNSLDKVVKNIQLLSGGATQNVDIRSVTFNVRR